MSQDRIRSFEEFWPFYAREHSKKATRQVHFLGTTAVIACAIAGVLGRRRWFAMMPVVGYGAAWYSHFFIEKNRPATFKYPLWSLKSDFVMWAKMLAGTMDDEVDRAVAAAAAAKVEAAAEDEAAKHQRDQTLN